jgi:hypothetical protein
MRQTHCLNQYYLVKRYLFVQHLQRQLTQYTVLLELLETHYYKLIHLHHHHQNLRRHRQQLQVLQQSLRLPVQSK